MEVSKLNQNLSTFLESGIYRFEDSNSVFIDPVRVLNQSYTRFRFSPSSYYSRFFESSDTTQQQSSNSRKRKRKEKKPYTLNERERAADRRHQEAKPFLLMACESLRRATDLLEVVYNLRDGSALGSSSSKSRGSGSSSSTVEHSFIELGRVWRAPLYEITLKFHTSNDRNEAGAENDCGFNLIVVDPPWENGSAHQKLRYPTLPNKYFLSLPIKKLSHTEGAIVVLWVINREKSRCFVEKELFPAWGVKYMTTFYWLKVKADGSLISDLDLFHHSPYECIILGQCHGEVVDFVKNKNCT